MPVVVPDSAGWREMENQIRRYVIVLVAFSALFYATAWMCDDAFITFRVVDNWVHGDGLRWNVLERVQVFTSPLFTLLMGVGWWWVHPSDPSPDPNRMYLLAMFVSYLLSAATVLVVTRRIRRTGLLVLALGILGTSQAFVYFCSSGLESCLTFLLLAAFAVSVLRCKRHPSSRQLYGILSLAALLVLTRIDNVLLVAPACVVLYARSARQERGPATRSLLLAALPLFAWSAFAVLYFGSLFPNSYYAKVGFVVSRGTLLEMGGAWLTLALLQDPITLVAIVAGLAVALKVRASALPLAIGAAAYVAYVVWIGGDFIGQRFLGPPLLIAVLLLVEALSLRPRPVPTRGLVALSVACLAYGIFLPGSPLRLAFDAPKNLDMRVYFEASRLTSWRPNAPFPFAQFHRIPDIDVCRQLRVVSHEVVISDGGLLGYCGGPGLHIITPLGITDPLIARLPMRLDAPFYPGHVFKPIPAGYMASIEEDANRISDPDLARYYEHIRRATQGPVLAPGRWRSIWQLHRERRYQDAYVIADPPYPEEFQRGPLPSQVEQLADLLRGWGWVR